MFGRFIPDFGRVVAQMQYDMYHVYTVDEHTLFAIGILHKIETGELKDELPLASADHADDRLAPRALSRDAAARHRQGPRRRPFRARREDRAEARAAPRALTAEETETVAWLVRWHLLMSNTAFKRDIGDPQTIRDFVERVQSPERLKLLLVLTVADIRAVGPKVWNGWKAALLRELYHRALEVMSGGLVGRGARRAHRRGAGGGARSCCPISATRSSPPSPAAATRSTGCRFDAETHARHARLMREAERERRAADRREAGRSARARSPRSRSTPPTTPACSRASPGRSRSAAPTSSTPRS